MKTEYWVMLALTAALFMILCGISLASEPRSGAYRWARRVFWTAALLLFSGALGGVGLNAFNLLASAVLGLPGYAGLTIVAGM